MATFRRALMALLVVTGPSAAVGQNRGVSRPTNLLKKLSLSEASISGTWTRTADGGIRCDSEAPARLRLAKAPKGEYDLSVVVTRQEAKGRLGILFSYDGIDFGWFMSEGVDTAGRGFAMVDEYDRSESVDQPLQTMPVDAKKRTVRFKVRREGVSAWVGKKKIADVTDYYDLAPVDDKDSVGEGFLGILCDRPSVVIHSITLTPVVESAGDDTKPASLRESAEEPGGDESGWSNDVLPITSTWNGVRKTLNRHGDIHCHMKVIERSGSLVVMRLSERGLVTRWTFAVNRGNLILQKFTQESGSGSVSEIQGSGAVSGGRVQINYQWVYSGPRAARAIIVGTIYLEED
ncbi:MAG TPA: hypothetical protein VJZ71_09130 [Phycisphaerae bacterium]|nr:hypothetical protein [Phycisphaerae bacterium]